VCVGAVGMRGGRRRVTGAVCGVADVGAPMRLEQMPRTLLTRLPCYSALELCPHRSAQIAMSPIIDPDHRCGLGRLETVGARTVAGVAQLPICLPHDRRSIRHVVPPTST
jgi:hypothetical protein